tara:strand:- start:444 stop:638 length:195 start_codon:yes stop_codon:yes gene_type:complete
MNVLKLKEVREKVSKLRILKEFGTLNEKGHIHLTTLEMLLNYNKWKEFDKWMNNLCEKNGTTNY